MSSKKSQTRSPIDGHSENNFSKDQDKFLPIANVSRIMKQSLPPNAKISKEAKQTVQECVSEFISFITGEASDKCQREKRKTINGDDLLWAMTILGFESYVTPLKAYLNKYREIEGEKSNTARQEDGHHNIDNNTTSELLLANNSSNNNINRASNNDISHMTNNKLLDFQDFNGGASFYSLCGGQVNDNNLYI